MDAWWGVELCRSIVWRGALDSDTTSPCAIVFLRRGGSRFEILRCLLCSVHVKMGGKMCFCGFRRLLIIVWATTVCFGPMGYWIWAGFAAKIFRLH